MRMLRNMFSTRSALAIFIASVITLSGSGAAFAGDGETVSNKTQEKITCVEACAEITKEIAKQTQTQKQSLSNRDGVTKLELKEMPVFDIKTLDDGKAFNRLFKDCVVGCLDLLQ